LHKTPPAPSQPPGTTGSKAPAGQAAKAEKNTRTKEYWQARFKTARKSLEFAREEVNVVKNELELLRIQQARELNPDRSRELNGRIDTATVEFEARQAEEEKARQAMEHLEKEFKESGAPQDWVPPEKSQAEPDEESVSPSGPGAGPPPRR